MKKQTRCRVRIRRGYYPETSPSKEMTSDFFKIKTAPLELFRLAEPSKGAEIIMT
ncbi:MAG TPA: hypothetical protein VK861_06945 [Bacteroidales bacterium]|nr:hypothetical protein [Bacteroidales bacterium]